MSRHFIYSTLTNDQFYTTWKNAGEGGSHHEVEHKVLIRGGSNVPNKNLITTRGTVTEITESDYDRLMGDIRDPANPDFLKSGNYVFKKHVQNGFLVHQEEKNDPQEVAASELKARDESAPILPNDERLQQGGAVQELTEKPGIVDKIKSMVGM